MSERIEDGGAGPKGSVMVPREFLDFLECAPVGSGVCCCGESMEGHSSPMECGHSPVDQWDHSLRCWLDEISARARSSEPLNARTQGVEEGR